MAALKLGQLMEMTAREMAGLSSSELRQTYQSMRKIVNSRINTFRKHDIGEAVPEKLRPGLGSAKGRSDTALLAEMKQYLAWMRGKRSTYRGYQESREDFRQKMQEAMPDLDLSTAEQMDAYGRFMGEMQERYGEMWHNISTIVRDLYRDLTKLNEDPRQFMKNYDYWSQHVEEINEAKRAAHAPGRRRSSQLSTYVNKLKRGKIK